MADQWNWPSFRHSLRFWTPECWQPRQSSAELDNGPQQTHLSIRISSVSMRSWYNCGTYATRDRRACGSFNHGSTTRIATPQNKQQYLYPQGPLKLLLLILCAPSKPFVNLLLTGRQCHKIAATPIKNHYNESSH
ncbi:Uncharacterized protein OBRU01_11108 [Operophtera brumata]|uniref:Uncharacterized protein n=1 Tax=Operophtera brumata TaxID=104452 RepID=A0A0L7LCI1_OPEBR|nr:Uncharacterized protein OBRU01_11108 [Operophtera brumata]